MARYEAWPDDEPVDDKAGFVCDWVGWCDRTPALEVELSNRAGSERLRVCRLHLAAARLYGYHLLAEVPASGDKVPAPAGGGRGRASGAEPTPAATSAPLGRAAGLLVFDGPEYLS